MHAFLSRKIFGKILILALSPLFFLSEGSPRDAPQPVQTKVLFDQARRALNQKHYSSAETQLRKLLGEDAAFQDASGKSAWFLLGRALELQGETEKAVAELERGERTLRAARREDPYLDFHLARLYVETGKYSKRKRVTPLVYRAVRNLVPRRQPDLWNQIYDILDIFLQKPEKKRKRYGEAVEKRTPGELLELLLRSLDPDPMTDENEALFLIFKRAEIARERYPDPTHPSGYDIRGDYFVRLGAPYRIYWTHSGVPGEFGYAIYPFEVWFYTKINPELYFTFARIRGESTFRQVNGPESVIGSFYGRRRTPFNRQHAGETVTALRYYLYSELALYHEDYRHRLYLLQQQKTPAEAADYADMRFASDDEEHARLAQQILQRVPVDPGEDVATLPLSVDHAVFRGKNGQGRLEIYFGVPAGAIFFEKTPSGGVCRLQAKIAVLNDGFVPVARDTLKYRISADRRNEIFEGGFVGTWQRQFPPGSYSLYVRLEDQGSQRGATFRDAFRVKDFHPDSLRLSDLELATAIRPDTARTEFVKDSLFVLPMPSGVLTGADTLYAYLEIYGLTRNSAGRTAAEVAYSLVWEEAGGGVKGLFARLTGHLKERRRKLKTVRRRAKRSQVAVHQAFPLRKLRKGKYRLRVGVRDLVSGRQAAAEKAFRLVEGE